MEKVLIFSNTLTGGGAERVASNLADGLVSLGYQVILYCTQTKDITYAPSSKVDLNFYPSSKSIKGLNIIKRIWDMRKIIRKHNPDIVIGIQSTNAFYSKIAQLISGHRIPVVYSEHNSLERPLCAKLSFMENFYKFRFSKLCDAFTVLTDADRLYGEKRGLKNIVVMPNPLQLTPINEIPLKENVVLAVGRLNVWHCKGFDVLVQAWEQIANKHTDWELQIVGAGNNESKEKIISYISDSTIRQKVKFINYTQNIETVYRQASIFVLSSRYEGFGLVLTEAMSQRCACVATNYNGRQGEIITDGVDGLLCATENVDDLAKKLELLIEDDELRKSIQHQSTCNLERYHPLTYAQKWDSLIKRLGNDRK